MHLTRRRALLVTSILVMGAMAGCGSPGSRTASSLKGGAAELPAKPSRPVVLNVLDVAGNLQLTQGMIDDFVRRNPDVVSKVTYSKAPSPDLVGKIKAQQGADRVDIGMVLTGTDGLAAGIGQGLWEQILPANATRLGNMAGYLEPAARMQQLAGDYGVTVTYYPSGPLLEYLPSKVADPPTTAQALLEYAKAHPGKVEYARPASSGPGRTFLMGLPYILGDSDPKNPETGWTKTWAYLAELGTYVSKYPTSTTQTMKDLANGSVDIVASTTGWDINPRVLGTVPAEAEVTTLQGFHWVTDAHYAVIPKGASRDVQSAVVLLAQFMLTKEQQAKAYDSGYFYPGPAVKGVDISMAPAKSQAAIKQFGRPAYDRLIADTPKEVPLEAKSLVKAFDIWDRQIGGSKVAK